jgi:hypothetical protein
MPVEPAAWIRLGVPIHRLHMQVILEKSVPGQIWIFRHEAIHHRDQRFVFRILTDGFPAIGQRQPDDVVDLIGAENHDARRRAADGANRIEAERKQVARAGSAKAGTTSGNL